MGTRRRIRLYDFPIYPCIIPHQLISRPLTPPLLLHRLPRLNPLGLDRSLHKGRSPPLCGLRSRISRQILRRLGLRWRHSRRHGRWYRPSLRDNGLLHLHEDRGNHQAQGQRSGCQAALHLPNLYGYLPQRWHQGHQPWGERGGNTADYELGVAVWVVEAGGDGDTEGHGEGEWGEDDCG